MEKNKTLLIMAAGMGSRFGGLKQIEPVGPTGEFIIDYSIYDALKAGFTKVVFIIKEENFELFKETVGKRIEDKIKVEYVFQRLEDLPEGYQLPSERVKPWGTAHAILSAKEKIHEPFAIINADDFYGRDAYLVISEFLDQMQSSEKKDYAMVAYLVKNTLTENGSVKRGVCEVEEGKLKKIIESKVEKIKDKIIASPLNGSPSFEISPNGPVSMNMFGFHPSIFDYIEKEFPTFLNNHRDDIEKCEYLIPDVVEEMMEKGLANVTVLSTNAKWQGVTYKEDKEIVVREINELIEKGEYPKKLWEEK